MKILWLKTGPLHPLDSGGKLRTFHTLKELAKRHSVTYLSLCPPQTSDIPQKSAGEYSATQCWIPWKETSKRSPRFFIELFGNLFSSLPYVISKYRSPLMEKRIKELAPDHDLVICDFLTPAINLFGARAGRMQTPTLLFQHNVEAQIWKRLLANASGRLKQSYFRAQWQRMRTFEGQTAARFDGVVGVSEEDCALMRKDYQLTNVLGSVPTGVDTAAFHTSTVARKPRSLVFLGSMDWMPNIDSMQFFAESIWPLLKSRYPDVTLKIVGRNPTPGIRELGQRDSSIQVTGTVEDVRPYLAECEVMVVPLRVGGGTRIKIYEGMATGIPVVSTRIGAEGLNVKDGENILLADTPDDFAQRLMELWSQPALRERVGLNGQCLVREHFSWDKAVNIFEKYCGEAVAKGKTMTS